MERYPFAYDPSRPFIQQASDWVADVFYELLPEAGFEVRDEQIYMAFQLEKAFAEKKTIFAESRRRYGQNVGVSFVRRVLRALYAEAAWSSPARTSP